MNVWIGQGVPQDWSSHRMGYALTAQFRPGPCTDVGNTFAGRYDIYV